MRLLLSGVIALVVLCRLAASGEGVALASHADPMGTFFRLATDFGGIGAFVVFLILDRKSERKRRDEDQAAERKRRDEDRERWRIVDQELINLVRECTAAISASTSILAEMRRDICHLTKSANGYRFASHDRHDNRHTERLEKG